MYLSFVAINVPLSTPENAGAASLRRIRRHHEGVTSSALLFLCERRGYGGKCGGAGDYGTGTAEESPAVILFLHILFSRKQPRKSRLEIIAAFRSPELTTINNSFSDNVGEKLRTDNSARTLLVNSRGL